MWDHPRSRGVYAGLNVAGIWADGSSPLARGLQIEELVTAEAVRIIPARAGFTAQTTARNPVARDHPRSRGVYQTGVASIGSHGGSSPLARGLQVRLRRERLVGRIIPARAGFTAARVASAVHSADHPRSRGVYRRGQR